MKERPAVLVAPLDWGLGHATRCIPIIRLLFERDCMVTLAADGRPADLLRLEFPNLEIARLPGYDIRYPVSGSMAFAMARQLPKIVKGINRERQWLDKFIATRQPNLVISDNRFGLWSKIVPCVYMTHQLTIKLPHALSIFNSIPRLLHQNAMGHFDEVWVPDYAGEPNLADELSHPDKIPPNVHYIGPLSRFTNMSDNRPSLREPESLDILAILSGPEPQRTIFEGLLLTQLTRLDIHSLVVLGKSEKTSERTIGKNVRVVSHLTSSDLAAALSQAKVVVARPGYSTLMDLAATGKPAILVPTPGQTEQEYLADRLAKGGSFVIQKQATLDLAQGWKDSQVRSGLKISQGICESVESRLEALLPNWPKQKSSE